MIRSVTSGGSKQRSRRGRLRSTVMRAAMAQLSRSAVVVNETRHDMFCG